MSCPIWSRARSSCERENERVHAEPVHVVRRASRCPKQSRRVRRAFRPRPRPLALAFALSPSLSRPNSLLGIVSNSGHGRIPRATFLLNLCPARAVPSFSGRQAIRGMKPSSSAPYTPGRSASALGHNAQDGSIYRASRAATISKREENAVRRAPSSHGRGSGLRAAGAAPWAVAAALPLPSSSRQPSPDCRYGASLLLGLELICCSLLPFLASS
jgi:hypothetical protein